MNPFDHGPEFVGGLIAHFRLLLHRPQDDFVEADVDVDFLRRSFEVFAGKLAGEHLVEDDAEGVDVGAVIDFGGMAEGMKKAQRR